MAPGVRRDDRVSRPEQRSLPPAMDCLKAESCELSFALPTDRECGDPHIARSAHQLKMSQPNRARSTDDTERLFRFTWHLFGQHTRLHPFRGRAT